jgi:hypothetical protein
MSFSRGTSMKVMAFQGVIENGEIKLPSGTVLPDNGTVYVLIPDATQTSPSPVRIVSPRLARPEQAVDFELEVVEGSSDAAV